MAQLAFAGLGAAIGSGFGGIAALGLSGTAIGWSIGGMIGGMLGPTQRVQGPRLADLKLTASTYGAPIPYVIGHPRIGGQIIWGSDRREISTTTSTRAKGGPKVKSTTFTYEIDLLIKLSCNEMAGIRKIFINGELQWTAASDADFGSIAASGALATRVTVYTGDDDQLPDPTYEAAVGIGNGPAYRGSLTIMLEGLQLGNAGQIPNITFEVMETATPVVNSHQIQATSDSPWIAAIGTPLLGPDSSIVMVGRWDSSYANTNIDVYQIAPDGVASFVRRVNSPVSNVATSGSSDEPVFATYSGGNGYFTWADGTRSIVATPPWRFAKYENEVILNPQGSVLYRYEFAGRDTVPVAGVLAATVTMPSATPNSIVVRGDTVFVLQSSALSTPTTRSIYVYDRATLTLLDTLTTPAIARDSTLLIDDDQSLHIVADTVLWRRDEPTSSWVSVRSIPLGYGGSGVYTNAGAGNSGYLIDGILYTQPYSPGGTGTAFEPVYIRASWQAAGAGERPLNEVVEELCVRGGIDISMVSAGSLASQVVRAYAVTPSTSRSVIEVLMQAYHFEAVCADALRFVPLGGAAVKTVQFSDLGTTAPGNFVEPFNKSERNDPEMPAFVTVKYMNVSNDFQDGAERSSRIATESEAEQFMELPLGMLPSEAKQAADFSSNITQMSLTTIGPLAVQLKHFSLQPTDVVNFVDRDGSTYRARITKAQWAKGIYQLEAVLDSASAVLSAGLTDEDYEETSVIRVPSTTIYVLGDWPLFRDVDDNIGHYWAATGSGEFWPGAALLKSADDVVYEQVSQVEERGVVGFATSVLANYTGPNIPDEGNSVRVNVGLGELASITYAEQIAEGGANVFMIGAECVIARVATYVSPGVYDLRGLLRGRKGTEWAVGTHAIGDPVTLIQPAGIRRVGMDLTELELERFYRAVTFGRPLDSGPLKTFANTGVSSKPYAPTNLDADRDALAGTTTIFWNRRTRLSQAWWLGNVPLGEESELWHIYRYTDGTYTTLAEPMVTSNTASYTFAVSGTVYVRIAQVSARVGEGYFLQGAV